MGYRWPADTAFTRRVLSVEGKQVLLLCKKGASANITSPPPHDGDGHLHLAFAIPAAELDAWESWLGQNGVLCFAVSPKRPGDPRGRIRERCQCGSWNNRPGNR